MMLPTTTLVSHIEALIFSSDTPLSSIDLMAYIHRAFPNEAKSCDMEHIQIALDILIKRYEQKDYAFEIKQSGGGYQFLTKAIYHSTIRLLHEERQLKKLSAAALETLAIIAYKQPITKNEIEIIRGVNCDYVVQKLLEKELIVLQGRNESIPGKPLLYATSKSFMDYFGINEPHDLPQMKEMNPTPSAPTTIAPI